MFFHCYAYSNNQHCVLTESSVATVMQYCTVAIAILHAFMLHMVNVEWMQEVRDTASLVMIANLLYPE